MGKPFVDVIKWQVLHIFIAHKNLSLMLFIFSVSIGLAIDCKLIKPVVIFFMQS